MYKLVVKNNDNKFIELFSSEDIFAIDCITGEYVDHDGMLKDFEDRLGMKVKEVFIKFETENRERVICPIVYSKHVIPSQDKMVKLYSEFLRGNSVRIEDSYLRNAINGMIKDFDIETILRRKMINYRTRRECYFHMVREGKIDVKDSSSVKEEVDFLKSMISGVDTDGLSDQDIMIEKIKSGEIEPNYYDLDDYVSMKKRSR